MTQRPLFHREDEDYGQQILNIPSGWTDNRWKRLAQILDHIDERLDKLSERIRDIEARL